MKQKIYAVDFDGTLVKNMYPKIGVINETIFDYVKEEQKKGHIIILWTCRTGESLNEAVNFCADNGLVFDYVNANTEKIIKRFGNDCRKIYADVYIDDKCINIDDFQEKRSDALMKEIRTCEIRAESTADADSLIIKGLPIVYDKPTMINDPKGSYTEIIRSGALDNADISDARLLYNHDLNKVPLARTPKTMQLMRSAAGLEMIAELPDTSAAQEVYTAVKRGDLSGMSFAFKVPDGGDRWNSETRTREIFKIEKIYEISIVPFPAYAETSVEARSVLKGIKEKEQLIIKCNEILLKE